MNEDLTILNSYLTELGVPPHIESLNDRIRVQKAIYLAQAASADLGYDYNWYLHGPYSPELANDYYKLSEAIFMEKIPDEINPEGRTRLKDSYIEILRSLAPIMQAPPDFDAPQEAWLELLASLHFLQKKKKNDFAASCKIIKEQKPQLLNYVDLAQRKLKESKLLV